MSHNSASDEINTKVISSLRREMFFAEGRYNAFVFASECKGNLSQLETEIRQTEESITEGLLRNPNGSMLPGMSPRIYKDGYLAGLKEAIQIVSVLTQVDPSHH